MSFGNDSSSDSAATLSPDLILWSSVQSSLDTLAITTPSSESLDPMASLSRSTTVTFAPLPPIEPRERRYTLGVAARSRAIKVRREMESMQNNEDDIPVQPPKRSQRGSRHEEKPPPEEEFPDPFEALGRFVKVASRSFRKRFPMKERHEEFVDTFGRKRFGGEKGMVKDIHVSAPDPVDISEEEEAAARVWEEEIGEEFRVRQIQRSVSDSALEVKRSNSSRRKSMVAVVAAVRTEEA